MSDRDLNKVPIVDDLQSRVVKLNFSVDVSISSVEEAWNILREMVRARGISKPEIEDACLYVPAPCELVGKRVAKELGIHDVVIVPPEMLLSYFTWELKFGLDSVLSTPSN